MRKRTSQNGRNETTPTNQTAYEPLDLVILITCRYLDICITYSLDKIMSVIVYFMHSSLISCLNQHSGYPENVWLSFVGKWADNSWNNPYSFLTEIEANVSIARNQSSISNSKFRLIGTFHNCMLKKCDRKVACQC